MKPARVATPAEVCTRIFPEATPVEGITTLISVGLFTVNGTEISPIRTETTLKKFVPAIKTVVPMLPLLGEKLPIIGGSSTGGGISMPSPSNATV